MSPRTLPYAFVCWVAGAITLCVATPATAWTTRIGPSSFHGVFAAARDGGVFLDPGGRRDTVQKLASDGTRGWTRRLPGRASRPVKLTDMEVAANGDLVAVGERDDGPPASTNAERPDRHWLAFRLNGRDGRKRWMADVPSPGARGEVNAVAIAPHGDVVVGGALGIEDPPSTSSSFAVIALSGEDGSERWRYVRPPSPPLKLAHVEALSVDAAGDVIAMGTLAVFGEGSSGSTVVKLDGSTGSERWRTAVSNTFGLALQLTATGDVLVGGWLLPGAMQVALLDGNTGAVRWTWNAVGSPLRYFNDLVMVGTSAVVSLADGDVVAAGLLADTEGTGEFTVVRLARAGGLERWRRVLPSDDDDGAGGGARAIALTPDGGIVVGGFTSHPGTCGDITIAELTPADGTVRRIRTLDGTARASTCWPGEPTPSGHGYPRFDRDALWGLEVVPSGRVVFAGRLYDRGQSVRGVIGSMRLE